MLKSIYHYWIIKKSGLFEPNFYLCNNPDVRKADMDPLWHFAWKGWKEGRNPSPDFDTRFYLEQYPDVKAEGVNPLIHYIQNGITERRKINRKESSNEPRKPRPTIDAATPNNLYMQNYKDQLFVANGSKGKTYVEEKEIDAPPEDPAVKLIAFYLPQYHPIPENDAWWGKGFTEWTNVGKAIPQFLGHYQPRLPGELGFYDLRIPEVMQRQIELAKNYGIHGFCFHYYWFSGKRLLEKPLNIFLSDPEMDFPFCICWANENWTRRWDGLEDDILITQKHDFENDKHFIADLEPILRDPRYIKINGRPLIIIYRPTLLENPQKAANYWRNYCQDHDLGDPIITSALVFGLNDPTIIGFEAAVEFPPNNLNIQPINEKMDILNPNYQGMIYDYREILLKYITPLKNNYRTFRTVIPSWDNEPRKPGRGHSIAYASPDRYARLLEQLCIEEIQQHPKDERVVFINAWNEWAESAYLEPDQKYGYAYLDATQRVLKNLNSRGFVTKDGSRTLRPSRKHQIAVILHVYYLDLFEEIIQHLKVLDNKFDLFISLPDSHQQFQEAIFNSCPNAYLYFTENRGRDIAPFIEIFRIIESLDYQYLLKLHTKKSIHRKDGEIWRRDIFNKLLGSDQIVNTVITTLHENSVIGIIGPKNHVISSQRYWGSNIETTGKLADDLGIPFSEDIRFCFVAGSMFWAKPKALRFLLQLTIKRSDFEPEPIPPDGTLAHACERIIGLYINQSDFNLAEIDQKGKISLLGRNDQYQFVV